MDLGHVTISHCVGNEDTTFKWLTCSRTALSYLHVGIDLAMQIWAEIVPQDFHLNCARMTLLEQKVWTG